MNPAIERQDAARSDPGKNKIFEFKYLSEFEFIFEKIQGKESMDQKGAFDEKKEQKSKISCKCSFS
jgi:hypothetical protein